MKNFYKFIIFCFVGLTSALIHLGIFNLSFRILNTFFKLNSLIFGVSMNYIIAIVTAITCAVIYNFYMNRNITFSAKGNPIKKQMAKYSIVYIVSSSANLIVSIIVLNYLGENTFNANIATISGIIFSIPINFFGSLLWTFKQKNIKNA
jgi:putative flippase GtrA